MKKTTKELNSKTINELQLEAQKTREEIAKMKLELKVNPPKNTNLIFGKRKKLAVILTVLKQKEELAKLKK
jgi:ribosomal protein L29